MMLDSVLNSKNKEYLGKILFGLSILILFGMVYLVFHKYFLTYDECFTLGLIKLPTDYGIYVTSLDVHPPLYYLIIKFFITILPIGNSNYNLVIVSKLISIIPYAIILAVSATFFKRRYGWLTCGLIAFSLATMTDFFLNYITMRMYSWSVLFLLLSYLSLYLILTENKTKYWVLLSLFTILGAYTHYFNIVSSAMLYLVFLVYLIYFRQGLGEIKKWLISAIIPILAYVPWIPSFFMQINHVNEGFWIPPVSFESLFDYLAYSFTISSDSIIKLIAVFALVILIIIIFKSLKNHEKQDNFYFISGIAIFLLTLLSGILVSLISQPILFDRYLLASISLMLIVMSILLAKIDNNKLLVLFLILLVLFAAVNMYENKQELSETHKVTVKHENFFNKINNDDSIVIFMKSNTLLRFGNFLDHANLYSIENRFGEDYHNHFDFTEINESGIAKLLDENPDKTVYFITTDKLEGFDNHKEIHLYSNLKIYSISKQGE